MVLRRAKETDLEGIYQLSRHCGIGLTTLPQDREILQQRLLWACESFAKDVKSAGKEYYLFVLEDASGQVVGTSAIEATIGIELPFYSYKVAKHTRICHSLGIRNDYDVLSLVNDYQGRSELCTLFLTPSFRHQKNGLLLSLARFLFIANFPHRFAKHIIAEMRGIADEQGNSPFWESVDRHFFHMPFAEADYLTMSTNKQFIADLMPRNSLYIQLLPLAAQAVIGKAHQSTLPAMRILQQQGFNYNGYVDIFDAGPTIEASCQKIRTIEESKLLVIKNLNHHAHKKIFLVANNKLDFKAIITTANTNEQYCSLNKKALELLEVAAGNEVRAAPLEVMT